jgi:hypothetical protein
MCSGRAASRKPAALLIPCRVREILGGDFVGVRPDLDVQRVQKHRALILGRQSALLAMLSMCTLLGLFVYFSCDEWRFLTVGRTELLPKSFLFRTLKQDQIELVASMIDPEQTYGLDIPYLCFAHLLGACNRFHKGEIIFRQGDEYGCFYLIKSGSVKLLKQSKRSRRFALTKLTFCSPPTRARAARGGVPAPGRRSGLWRAELAIRYPCMPPSCC